MMKIEIISREAIKPSSPTPSHLKTFSLSLIDQPIPHTFFPIILYYSQKSSMNLTRSQISCLLKISLSNTLNLYYPLAGRMKGEASVDCNDEGVDYLEALVDCSLTDIIKLPRVEVLSRLIPLMNNGVEGAMDVQLSIQCNFFSCGGLALGFLFSHRIGDCCTWASFQQTWAKMARGEENMVNPSFDSSSIFPPKDPFGFTTGGGIPEKEILTKIFCFSGSKIAALQEKVMSAPTLSKPTRVESVIALIWKCAMNATRGKGYMSSVATEPVNIRSRMDLPLPQHSFGNIFRTAYAHGEFEMDLASLAGKLREGVGEINMDGIKRFQEDGYRMTVEARKRVMEMSSSKEVLWVKFASWCRFPFYEVDFGWGEPAWVSCAKIGVKDQFILLDSKFGGGIEAWVNMEEEDMRAFQQDLELQAFTDAPK